MGMIWRIQNPLDEKLVVLASASGCSTRFFQEITLKIWGSNLNTLACQVYNVVVFFLIASVLLITINTLMWFILNWLMRNNFDTLTLVFGIWVYFFDQAANIMPVASTWWQRWGKRFFYEEESSSRAQDFKALALLWMLWVARGWKTDNTFREIPAEICHLLFFTSVF